MCATLLVSCVQVVALHITRLSIAAFWLRDVLQTDARLCRLVYIWECVSEIRSTKQTDAMHFSFYVFV